MKAIVKKYFYYFTRKLCNRVKITNKGKGSLKTDIRGSNNVIKVGGGTFLENPFVLIIGNNNQLVIGNNCKVRKHTIFRIEGNGVAIHIGDSTTLQHDSILVAQQASINIGSDCMFSNNIHIRSSDSHPIYDNETGEIINKEKEVCIGNHVWLAANCKILKGCVIEDGAVVGAHSIVTKHVLPNVIVAGNPARVIKNNITWKRHKDE